ncbi:PRC-barrel domain-containing protein [Kitasatospora phosalacinea]|uniref:PRC-barrel domain-containing protein n=1 Tax=Kitasatospora phosalacinea TaxID=2065 RepID=A0ABW6GLI5_9ACTN
MIEAADIRAGRTHDVVDADGHDVGTPEAIHADTGTHDPAMAAVRIGPPTRHRPVLVPLDGVGIGPGHVEVVHEKPPIKDRPSVGAGDALPAEDEEAVLRHHRPAYRSGTAGERQLARR